MVVPVGCLQDGVLPELISEHLLDEANHAPQGVSHPVVLNHEIPVDNLNTFFVAWRQKVITAYWLVASGRSNDQNMILVSRFISKSISSFVLAFGNAI